jgi:hypothetical protein
MVTGKLYNKAAYFDFRLILLYFSGKKKKVCLCFYNKLDSLSVWLFWEYFSRQGRGNCLEDQYINFCIYRIYRQMGKGLIIGELIYTHLAAKNGVCIFHMYRKSLQCHYF